MSEEATKRAAMGVGRGDAEGSGGTGPSHSSRFDFLLQKNPDPDDFWGVDGADAETALRDFDDFDDKYPSSISLLFCMLAVDLDFFSSFRLFLANFLSVDLPAGPSEIYPSVS